MVWLLHFTNRLMQKKYFISKILLIHDERIFLIFAQSKIMCKRQRELDMQKWSKVEVAKDNDLPKTAKLTFYERLSTKKMRTFTKRVMLVGGLGTIAFIENKLHAPFAKIFLLGIFLHMYQYKNSLLK